MRLPIPVLLLPAFPFFCGAFLCIANRDHAEGRENNDVPLVRAPLPQGAITQLGSRQPLKGYIGSISVVFLSDGRTVAQTGPVNTVNYWDWRTRKLSRSFPGHEFVAFSPKGTMIASRAKNGDNVVRFLDATTQEELGRVGAEGPYQGFWYSPDGAFLAIGARQNPRPNDLPLRLVKVPTGEEIRQFPVKEHIQLLVFSPDGKIIVTEKWGQKPRIQAWDVSTGKELRHFDDESRQISPYSIAISPDGMFFAGAGGGGIRIWELGSANLRLRIFSGDSQLGNLPISPVSIAFSPNGKMFAVGGFDDRVRESSIYLFDTASGGRRARFGAIKEHIVSLAFSPSGLLLASAGRDADFLSYVWDVTGVMQSKDAAPSEKDLEHRWGSLAHQPGVVTSKGVLWADMRAEENATAWQAICMLTAHPNQSVPFLKKHLPNPRFDPKVQVRLKADLDSDAFATRERAWKELAEVGPAAIPFLRKLLASNPSVDAKQRIDTMLGQPGKGGLLAQELQCVRAIEALEYIGTPAAKALLETQSQGDPGSAITIDAKAALARLAKLPAR